MTPAGDQRQLRARSRIAAHVILDHLTDPPATSSSTVPWRPEAITAEWFSSVVALKVPGAQVTSVTVAPASEGTTVRRSVEVTYNDVGNAAGLPEHLFAKSTPTLLTRLLSSAPSISEQRFFADLRDDLAIEAPTMAHSCTDRESGRSLQLFVDLGTTKGATFCGPPTHLDEAQAQQAVEILATIHGQLYDSERFATDLRWLRTYEDFFRLLERAGNRQGHDEAMVRARSVMPTAVFERREETWPAAARSLSIHASEPRTLLHSDVHLGNWYVTDAGRVGLADWQCVSTGHWSRDLAYAISTLLPADDRRAWEADLLEHYRLRLSEAGGPQVTPDVVRNRYRQQMFAALLMWTPTLCHAPTLPDMQPEEMSMLMIERITTAIDDVDSFGSLDDV